ncbi:MAG: diacylglycerol/lipid kinase family protein [Verrucomicrobiales bacterium]
MRVPSQVIIFNPAARGEKAGGLEAELKALTRSAELWRTEEAGDAERFARRAVEKGVEMVIAAGGDGTINEVVRGLASVPEAEVTLGLLPTGTMNVFAYELGLPTSNLKKCWEVIQRGHTRRIDLPRANGHPFVQMAGVGFDAQIVENTKWEDRKNFGPLSYLFSAAQVAGETAPALTIIRKNEPLMDGSFVLVGNGRYYGGPFVLFKEANMQDGLLDVLVFQNLGIIDLLRYVQGIIFGTLHPGMDDVKYFQTASLEVYSTPIVPVEVDGEVIDETPVRLTVQPAGLLVCAPPEKVSRNKSTSHAK